MSWVPGHQPGTMPLPPPPPQIQYPNTTRESQSKAGKDKGLHQEVCSPRNGAVHACSAVHHPISATKGHTPNTTGSLTEENSALAAEKPASKLENKHRYLPCAGPLHSPPRNGSDSTTGEGNSYCPDNPTPCGDTPAASLLTWPYCKARDRLLQRRQSESEAIKQTERGIGAEA